MERAKIVQTGRQIIQQISPDYRVLNGPFQGLHYPTINLQRSSLPARIIGSYERQLHPFIEKIIATPYDHLLDIGSAEGYYAVGFAQRMPRTTVHCYDTDLPSMEFCRQLAQVNGVSNLTFNGFCSQDTLRSFADKGRTFIFSDCEGYELDLFTTELTDALSKIDLLIELHDVFRPGLSTEIMRRFRATHHIHKIDNSQIDLTDLQGIDSLSKEDTDFACCEHRGGFCKELTMEWIFLTAK